MKNYILFAAVLAAACQPAETKIDGPLEDNVKTSAVQNGVVALRLGEPVSEPRACIIPISVENGLEDKTSVTLIAFDLSGSGEDAKGNMFATPAPPGGVSEARVIVEGQSCAAFDTITIPEIRCTSGEESCEGKVELMDGMSLSFSRAG